MATATDISFADLIRPLPPPRFFAEHWERRPFVGGCEKCTALIGLADVEQLISSLSNPDPSWLNLVKQGRELPTSAFLREDGFVSLQRVYDAFEAGHTIQMAKLDRRWPPVQRLARAVEREFAAAGVILSRHVGSHLYLTPRSGVALAPHFDSHDVLVLQVAGEKRWLLYEPTAPLPVERQRGALPALGDPTLDRTLRAGDVMFIPRGWPHHAGASSNGSIHVTLDLWPATWCELLSAALKEEPWARLALPVGLGLLESKLGLQAGLLEKLGSREVLQRAAQSLAGRFVERLSVLPGGGLEGVLAPPEVTENTRLVRRSGAVPYVDSDAERVRLHFPESALSAPKAAELLFTFLEEHGAFTVAELPGPLAPAERVALARQLVREQFLAVAEEEGGGASGGS